MATSCSVRAETLLTRYSDIIVKSKKFIEESSNGAVVRIAREKLLKEREEEEAMIETRALRQRLREQQRLALEKMEEEARSNTHDDHLATVEIATLCGGSAMSRSRWWLKHLGLVLRTDDEYDDDSLEKAPRHDDIEECEIV